MNLELALAVIAARGCHSYASAGGCTTDASRSPVAQYGSDQWCAPCVARRALTTWWQEWAQESEAMQ